MDKIEAAMHSNCSVAMCRDEAGILALFQLDKLDRVFIYASHDEEGAVFAMAPVEVITGLYDWAPVDTENPPEELRETYAA